MTDSELLHAYAVNRSEDAFAPLIDRYVRLIYSACARQLADRHLAEDATQGVFVLMSQKAGKLPNGRLAGWLLTTNSETKIPFPPPTLKTPRRVCTWNGNGTAAFSTVS